MLSIEAINPFVLFPIIEVRPPPFQTALPISDGNLNRRDAFLCRRKTPRLQRLTFALDALGSIESPREFLAKVFAGPRYRSSTFHRRSMKRSTLNSEDMT